ncbi:hypothetical protein L9F63_027515, partial [Diploptera punctata]
ELIRKFIGPPTEGGREGGRNSSSDRHNIDRREITEDESCQGLENFFSARRMCLRPQGFYTNISANFVRASQSPGGF